MAGQSVKILIIYVLDRLAGFNLTDQMVQFNPDYY